jgi:sodium transport system permease protein
MWLVYKKELLELTRDKKTLIFTILLPMLILPLLFGIMIYFTAKINQTKQDEVLKYVIEGGNNAPELVEILSNVEKFSLQKDIVINDIPAAIRSKQVKFVIVIPDSYKDSIANHQQAKITLHYNAASKVDKVKSRIEEAIKAYKKSLQILHMEYIGIDETQLKSLKDPIEIEVQSIANKREKIGELLGGFAAYMLLLITLSGAIYPALDLGVGEKERQTLETLLLNPLPRWHLVIAKYLVIFTTGFISVFLTLFSLLMWSVLAGQAFAIEKLSDILASIGISTIGMMLLMLVPTAGLFAAILLMISIYARNFKEAQNYMSPLMIMVIMPVAVSMIPGIELNWSTAMIPLTNIALAMKEIVKGTIETNYILVIFGSTTVLAGAMLWFCSKWFQKEKVLFRT